MNNSAESKLFGLPRPLAGALIGVLIFLVILLPLKYLDYNSLLLYMLALDLELLGRMTILMLGTAVKINLPQNLSNFLSVTISAIPAGMLGMLIATSRTRGVVLAVLYLLTILACGTLMTLAGV